MSRGTDLTNHFLIAMPGLQDSNFSRTVTYICEHNPEGAMGIIINRPIDLHLTDILAQLDLSTDNPVVGEMPIYQGGPVQTERGFVLHSPATGWDSTLRITDDVSVTTSRDILEAIAKGGGPSKSLIALGYAGWGSGQLEAELSANAWLNGPASDTDIIFEMPANQRWQAAASLLGVDINLLSAEAGHA